jgi:predicted ATPase/DNA-binding CsgD family transcriptional regulator
MPDEMTAAIARLDRAVFEAIATHHGVRPVEQGEGDSFVIAFGRASDAVACAVALQLAPLAPIRLRIGIHTGEVRLRDEGNYIGPTINRTARLRDLAHGGQTLLSGATEPLVTDQLPTGVSLTDLGAHPLRDLPRPERVFQLCYPDLRNGFPPLRSPSPIVAHNLPLQLTSFIGRQVETTSLRDALGANRFVTLTGAGGSGKTRLAVHVAAQVVTEFGDGVWYVDLAPITNPDAVPVTAARTLGLPDQPGRSTMETLLRFVRDRRMLVVLDNCEHLLDASATLVGCLLRDAPGIAVLATSREPLGLPGEAIRQVPSLSLADDAIELFADRARLAKTEFTVNVDNVSAVAEICHRLDGMPLAIEFAAARVRALSLTEILESLHDRFRLLTGGSRTAVRRQQTLHASVDWSHALLSEPERVLFRRLAVFLGGFDLDAARAVASSDVAERYQVLDQLGLLVDKSLVMAETTRGRTRYRLLETVRQYALEKLGESAEADTVRARHRDHYAQIAALLDTPGWLTGHERRLDDVELEIDNVRAAFEWSLEDSDIERAATIASSLQRLWLNGGRIREGLAWFGAILSEENAPALAAVPGVHARVLADKSVLDMWAGSTTSMDQARQALEIAREVDDPALLARALAACGFIAGNSDTPRLAQQFLVEGIELARSLDDKWVLSQMLVWQAQGACVAGDPATVRAAAEEVRDIGNAIGYRSNSRDWGQNLGWAYLMQGDLSASVAEFRAVLAEARAFRDPIWTVVALQGLGFALAYQGAAAEARSAAEEAIEVGAEFGEFVLGLGHSALATAALAGGDVATARHVGRVALQNLGVQPATAVTMLPRVAEAELASGDVAAARCLADEAVETNTGWYQMLALTTRARVLIVQGDRERATRDVHDALARASEIDARACVPDILECLADIHRTAGGHHEAARLYGAAQGIRGRVGAVRFLIHELDYQDSITALRDAMGVDDFGSAWEEGCALSTEDAIAYAQRGRGSRKRATSGWESLTHAELDVVRLVSEGLTNSEVAARLFISPRTVQTHLTHVYTKLDLTSRVQLVQEAARHV